MPDNTKSTIHFSKLDWTLVLLAVIVGLWQFGIIDSLDYAYVAFGCLIALIVLGLYRVAEWRLWI